MRVLSFALIISAALYGSAASAQPPASNPPGAAVGPSDNEKVKQVFVYGSDPCPAGTGDEIVVCARMPDNERYRIPKELRTDPNSAAVQSWVNRARSIEYVGAEGINSCSPTGAGGITGCFAQIAREAREERQKMLGSASWADAVAKAREERLGNLDVESAQIEAKAKAEEEEAAQRKAAQEAREKAAQQGPARQP